MRTRRIRKTLTSATTRYFLDGVYEIADYAGNISLRPTY